MKKLNCWEIRNCGLQAGGSHTEARGVCPASTVVFADGINGGTFAGRACWGIPGTLCGNTVQESVSGKQQACRQCRVFLTVKVEEGENFLPLEVIREELQSYTCY